MALHGVYRRATKSEEHKKVRNKMDRYQIVVTGGRMENDKDVLFISDAIRETKGLIKEIGRLSNDYGVHPYTLSLGFIRASSVMGAVAATAIYNHDKHLMTKTRAACKVLQIYKDELFEIIGEADSQGSSEH